MEEEKSQTTVDLVQSQTDSKINSENNSEKTDSGIRQLFFDTETTGTSPEQGHKIIEIGMVEAIDGQPTGNVLHRYINPQREVDKEAYKVHGISSDFLKDKPIFSEIMKELIDFVQDAELIAHNAEFDLNFINHELKNQGFEQTIEQVSRNQIDSLDIARKLYPNGKGNSLDKLATKFKVDHRERSYHGALLDSEILLDVFNKMAQANPNFNFRVDEFKDIKEREPIKKYNQNNRPKLVTVKASSEDIDSHNAFLGLKQEIEQEVENSNPSQSHQKKMKNN